tara:strand:+ start:653 stop:1390 length:738 start_codon:yes stop_codon:yes gene_type:complete
MMIAKISLSVLFILMDFFICFYLKIYSYIYIMRKIHKEKISSNSIEMNTDDEVITYADYQKHLKEKKAKQALAQQIYRKTKKGKAAIKRGNNKAKEKDIGGEKARKNSKQQYEAKVAAQIAAGIKIKRRTITTKKETEELVKSWSEEPITSLKNGIYISYRKLKINKKRIQFKKINKAPHIDVGFFENEEVEWTGMKYIKANPQQYKKKKEKKLVKFKKSNHIKYNPPPTPITLDEDGLYTLTFD